MRKLNQFRADLKFWLWKTRTLNAKRYVSILTLLAALVGVSFYSLGGIIKKVAAANAANVNLQTGALTVDGGNFLLDSNKCIWPTDAASKITIIKNDGTPLSLSYDFHGKVCLDGKNGNSTTKNVVVQNGGVLSVMGEQSFTSLTVSSGGKVTHPTADANARAVTYTSRSTQYAMQFTFFVKVEAPSSRVKTVEIWPASNTDDAMIIEAGAGALPGTLNVDDPTVYNLGLSWERNSDTCSRIDSSFFQTGVCGGSLSSSDHARHITLAASAAGDSVRYVPVRVTTWQTYGTARYDISYVEKLCDRNVSGTLVNCSTVANNPQYLPTSYIYAPSESADSTVGTADATASAQGKARFVYATPPKDYYTDPNWGLVSRDLTTANRLVSGTTYASIGTPEHAFFSRIDLTNNGTLKNFGKYDCTSSCTNVTDAFAIFFDASWPNESNAGNPLSNAERLDSLGYRLGVDPYTDDTQPRLIQNYKLQTHDDAAPAISAILDLDVSGDATINSGSIDVVDKGLPGGVSLDGPYKAPNASDNGDRGVSGVGGKGNTSPGWWLSYYGNTDVPGIPGSDWGSGNGGGGGAANKKASIGYGGGGGGMGFGSAGSTYYDGSGTTNYTLNSTAKSYYAHGQGGAGLYGSGGGKTDTSSLDRILDYDSMFSGTSFRERYTATTTSLLGGGGGSGSEGSISGVGRSYNGSFPAGSGGGAIKLAITGNLNLSGTGKIIADGGSGISRTYTSYEGTGYVNTAGGGGGTVDLSVSGTFSLTSTALVSANGGSSYGLCLASSGSECGVPGQGGGGLVRVTASVYDGDGWIFTPNNYCDVNGGYVGVLSNSVQAAAGKGIVDSGKNLLYYDGSSAYGKVAEHGIIDLKYPGDTPFCGSGAGAGSGIQISKQIEQLSALPADSANAVSTASGSNVVTVTTGSIIRVTITISNLSTVDRVVTISDTLPKTNMTINNSKVYIYNSTATSFSPTVSGGKFTQGNLTVPASSYIQLKYVSQVQ